MTLRQCLVAAAALAAGLMFGAAAAQPAARPARIAFILSDFEVQARPAVEALRAGLLELGQVEGRHYQFDIRYAQGQMDRLAGLVGDAIDRGAEVMVTSSYPATAAARQATRTIPIAGYSCGLEFLVDSLARPGGNVSGVTCQSAELVGKQIQLLWEVLPAVKRVAVFYNPLSNYSEPVVRTLQEVGNARGKQVIAVAIRTAADFDNAIVQIRQANAEAVFLAPDAVLITNRVPLLALLAANRLPVMGFFREFVDAGALISYSANRVERHRRLAWYVDRMLKGAKPSDLPVDQPTRFELVINLKTARALGVKIPQAVLLRVDEVVE
jgi:putative tryptophan/tyrosine transport system substrate-binding protein